MKRPFLARTVAAALSLIAASGALSACGKEPAAGILLAIDTDLVVPDDIDAVALVFTNATTGATIGAPIVRATAPSQNGNAVRFPSTITLETAFETSTFSISKKGTRKIANVQISLVGLKGGATLAANAQVLRRIFVAMPENGIHLLKLNLDALSLGGATGTLDEGGLGSVQSTCPDKSQDFVLGICRPVATFDVEAPRAGDSATASTPSSEQCFDIPTCFSESSAVTLSADCSVPVPAQVAFGIADVGTSNGGEATCVTEGGVRRCYTVLDAPSSANPYPPYTVANGTATFDPGLCAALKAGTFGPKNTPIGTLRLTTKCVKNVPLCTPWSSVQNENNNHTDFPDAGADTGPTSDSGADSGPTDSVVGTLHFLEAASDPVTIRVGGKDIELTENKSFSAPVPAGVPWEVTIARHPNNQFCNVLNGTGTGPTVGNTVEVRCAVAHTFFGTDETVADETTTSTAFTPIAMFPAQTVTLDKPVQTAFLAYQIPTVSGTGAAAETGTFAIRLNRKVGSEIAIGVRTMPSDNPGGPVSGVAVVPLLAGTTTFELVWKSQSGSAIRLFRNDGRVQLRQALTVVALDTLSTGGGHTTFSPNQPFGTNVYGFTNNSFADPLATPYLFVASGLMISNTSPINYTATLSAGGTPLVSATSGFTSANAAQTTTRSVPLFALQGPRANRAIAFNVTSTGTVTTAADGSNAGSVLFEGLGFSAGSTVETASNTAEVTSVSVAGSKPRTEIASLSMANVPEAASVLVITSLESSSCGDNYLNGHVDLDLLGSANVATVPLNRSYFMSNAVGYRQPHLFATVVKKLPGVPFVVKSYVQTLDNDGTCTVSGHSSLSGIVLR